MNAVEALRVGFSEKDRCANDDADAACSALADAHNPTPEHLAARAAQLAAAMLVHMVMASIQEAALEEHHRPGTAIAKHKWARRRPVVPVRKPVARPHPAAVAIQQPAGPTVIHSGVINPGPLPLGHLGNKVVG